MTLIVMGRKSLSFSCLLLRKKYFPPFIKYVLFVFFGDLYLYTFKHT